MDFFKSYERRVQTRRVQPIHLYMAVGPDGLTEEEYTDFVRAWLSLNLPHVNIGGGVVDLRVDDVIQIVENTSGIKKQLGLGWNLPNKVVEEAKKVRQRLRGY